MTPALQLFAVSTKIPGGLPWAFLDEQPAKDPDRMVQLHVAGHAMPLIGDRLLRADDPMDFESVLDQLLSDPVVAKAYFVILDCCLAGGMPSLDPDSSLRPEVGTYCGEPAASLLCAAKDDLFAQAEAFVQLVSQLGPGERGEVVESFRAKPTLDWFVTDGDCPPLLLELALSWTTGGLCGLALALAADRKERVPDWLGLLMAERYVLGARAYVKFVGSLPGIRLSRPLKPSERLDLERLSREHQEAMWGLRLSMLQHRAGGQAISAPFGELPGDE